MKKTLLLYVFGFFLDYAAYSQACTISTDTAHLDVNNARVILQASGDLFWSRQGPGYFVPKLDANQLQTTILSAGGFWIGGLDDGGNLKMAAQTYGASAGNTDWWPGPLDSDEGTSNASICNNFDKLWKINRNDIVAHIADFAADSDIDGPVPASVLAWPGRDNPQSLAANGFTLPIGAPLAPFVDRNGNGKYEPIQGDYPKVTGDQAIWWVFNDEGGGAFHGESNGIPLRVEIHALAYGFEGNGNEDLENTQFYDFTIYNRAKEAIDSTYTSLWVDTDLGCDYDDYFGSISEEKMMILYNQDAQDGTTGCDCIEGPSFCEDIPVVAVKVLRGPSRNGEDQGFSSFTYYNNTVFNQFAPMSDPVTDIEFYGYMTGSWRDGTPFTYGGDGYDISSNQPYPFVFDGNPSDDGGWSQCNDSITFYDQSKLINSGPFRLEPGQHTSVCYAVMTKFGLQQPCPDMTPLLDMANAVEQYCASLTPTDEIISANNAVHFYPNPLRSEGKLTANGEIFESVRLLSLDGRTLREYSHLNTTELTIERGELPNGFYLYTALLRNGQVASGKIVIQ